MPQRNFDFIQSESLTRKRRPVGIDHIMKSPTVARNQKISLKQHQDSDKNVKMQENRSIDTFQNEPFMSPMQAAPPLTVALNQQLKTMYAQSFMTDMAAQ